MASRSFCRGKEGVKLFLFFLFIFFVSARIVVPEQAFADAATTAAVNKNTKTVVGKMIEEIAILKDIAKVFTFLNDKFKEYVGVFKDKLDTLIAVTYIGDLIKAKQKLYMHEDMKAFEAAKAEQQEVAKIAGTNYWHPRATRPDCVTIIANIKVQESRNSMYALTDAILKAVEQRSLGAVGLEKYTDYYQLACPEYRNYPKGGIYNASKPPPECKSKTEQEEGLAISSRSLSFNIPKAWPPMKKVTGEDGKTYEVPNPQTEAEKNAVAALMYIYFLAGKRTSPPQGEELNTAEGRIKLVKWNECHARQSAALRELALSLSYQMKPNCKKNANLFKKECEAGKKLCEKAALMKINCKDLNLDPEGEGLSAYDAEYVQALVMSSAEMGVQLAGAGREQGSIAVAMQMNNLAWLTWQNKLTTQSAAAAETATQLANLDCWPPDGGPARLAFSDKQEKSSYNQPEKLKNGSKMPETHQKNNVRARVSLEKRNASEETQKNYHENNLPVGVPISSDELFLPVVVPQ